MNIASSLPQTSFEADLRDRAAVVAPEESLGVRAALALLWQGRWSIAAGALVGLMLAGLYVAASAPRYTAVATVLYDPGARTLDLAQAAPHRSSDDLRNQIEILRSTSLIDRVVADLDLARSVGPEPVRHAVPATGGGLRGPLDWNAWVRRNWGGDAAAADTPAAPGMRAAPAAEERAALRAARDSVRDGLTLLPLPASSVIEISYTADEPVLSARIVNGIAKQYVTAQLDATLSSAREATAWLAARVEELRRDVEAAEAAVASYEARLAEATGTSAAAMKLEIDGLSRTLAEASARRSAAGIRYQRAASEVEDPGRIAAIADFQTSELMRSYRAQEADLSSDRAALGKLVPEGHERLQAIDGRIAYVGEAIRAEAERITEALGNELEIGRANEAALEAELRRLREAVRSQQHKEVRLRQLESEAAASRLIYESFLRRLKETTQRAKLEHGDAIILSPAEAPAAPDSANTNRTLAAGLIFGGMLGFGAVFLFSQLNTTVRGIEQAEQLTGLAVLGTIPTLGRRRRRRQVLQHALDRPTSPLAESVRSLRTSLLFASLDRPPTVVMLVSSVASEGKSTSSILLALMSAQMGKSAIVVDCDLRRPSLHTLLETEPGVSHNLPDVLAGSVSLEEAIEEDPETRLHFLAGRPGQQMMSANAADILSSGRFHDVVEELRSAYDLVILDAPPVLSVTDARIVGNLADAVLYCVRWDHTSRGAVLEGLREFAMVGQKITGLVLTMVDQRKASSYGYSDCGYGTYKNRAGDPYLDA